MKHEDRASVEESRELLVQHMRGLVERASQSGSHLECIIGAGTVLGAMCPLLSAAAEHHGGAEKSGVARYVQTRVTQWKLRQKTEKRGQGAPLPLSGPPPADALNVFFQILPAIAPLNRLSTGRLTRFALPSTFPLNKSPI